MYGYVTRQAARVAKLCTKPLLHDGKLVPWYEPIASVVGSRWAAGHTPVAMASAGALAEGGWWTQERLAEANLAANPYCRACLADERPSELGSLWHRTSNCAGTKPGVLEKCPKGLRKLAQDSPSEPLFADGVP